MNRVLALFPTGIVRPAVTVGVAAAIVLVLGTFASSVLLRGANQGATMVPFQNSENGNVEHVMLRPKLKVNAPSSQGAQAQVSAARSALSSGSSSTQIARVGEVDLYVRSVEKSVAAIASLVHRQSGDVLSLSDQGRTGNGAAPSAQMEIRVPEWRFAQTMEALGQVGSTRSRTITAEDLAGQIVDSSARLRNLRRTESDIQKIMDRSGSVAQVLDAENQLSSVREQIETLDADVKSMQTRVRYSTITIAMSAEASSVPAEPSGVAQLGNAWRAALHAVSQFTVQLIGTFLWMVAFAPYCVLAFALTWALRVRIRKAVEARSAAIP